MKKYIIFIITAALFLGGSTVQADKSHKTNKVAHAKGKASPNQAKAAEARKKYAAAAKKIREAVKTGKLTEAQAKEKYAALRKKMAPHRASKEAILKRFDKNKDGKLCDQEKAAMRKAIAERVKRGAQKGSKSRRERGDRSRRGGDRKKRPVRK